MAVLTLDPRRTIGTVDRKLFGNFIEHIYRCVNGGVYDPSSGHADADGMRTDVIEAAKRLGVTTLRWPGGTFASGYHWKEGIGPKDQRPARPSVFWGGVETNAFGTDEFIAFCRKVGAEPSICLNLGSGDMQEAENWLEYCNGSQPTSWAGRRRANGHADPFNVKYWFLGNEPDMWAIGHMERADYCRKALEIAKVMNWMDPSIQVIAAGAASWQNDWGVPWDYAVTEHLCESIHGLSLHLYFENKADNFLAYMASAELMDQRIEASASAINAARAARKCAKPIYIAMDEWGVWYRTWFEDKLEERYNLEDALAIALGMNSLINHADVVKMANLAQLVNVIAPMITEGDRLLIQSIFHPLALYAAANSGIALETRIDGEAFPLEGLTWTPLRPFTSSYVHASATLDGTKLTLNLVNRHPSEPQAVEIRADGASLRGQLTGSRVVGDGAKAENTLDNPHAVRTESLTPIDASGRVTLILPPMSVSVYHGELA